MTDTLHSQFCAWLTEAHRRGEVSDEAYRLGDIVARYIFVSEQVPDPTPELVDAAKEALREFKEAMRK